MSVIALDLRHYPFQLLPYFSMPLSAEMSSTVEECQDVKQHNATKL